MKKISLISLCLVGQSALVAPSASAYQAASGGECAPKTCAPVAACPAPVQTEGADTTSKDSGFGFYGGVMGAVHAGGYVGDSSVTDATSGDTGGVQNTYSVYSKGAFGGVVGGVDYSAGCAYFGAEGFGLFGQSKSENKYTGDFEFDRTSETKRVFGVLGKVGAKIGGAVAYLQGGYVGSSIHTAGRVNTNADETDEVKVKEDHTLHGLGGGAGVDMALSNGLTVGASFLYSAAPNKKLFADYKAGDGDDAQNMTMDLTHHNTMGLVSVKYRVGGM